MVIRIILSAHKLGEAHAVLAAYHENSGLVNVDGKTGLINKDDPTREDGIGATAEEMTLTATVVAIHCCC
jgi:hypothetical protein